MLLWLGRCVVSLMQFDIRFSPWRAQAMPLRDTQHASSTRAWRSDSLHTVEFRLCDISPIQPSVFRPEQPFDIICTFLVPIPFHGTTLRRLIDARRRRVPCPSAPTGETRWSKPLRSVALGCGAEPIIVGFPLESALREEGLLR